MTEFGAGYAGAYDALYGDKDYEREVDLIESAVTRYAAGPVHTVLDLGCGTGNHAFPLMRRGYAVTGVDRSEFMIARAQEKASTSNDTGGTFQQGDIRTLDLDQSFDLALMMFAVLGYQLENDDVLAALATARRHLAPGGILLFDVWYGPAVLREGPSTRSKRVEIDGGEMERVARAELDTRNHLCTVHYELRPISGGANVVEESHRMRYFFPRELELFLRIAGFELVRLGSFDDIERDPDDATWNVTAVARAV
jgi:SAM-dependent methyltransferase